MVHQKRACTYSHIEFVDGVVFGICVNVQTDFQLAARIGIAHRQGRRKTRNVHDILKLGLDIFPFIIVVLIRTDKKTPIATSSSKPDRQRLRRPLRQPDRESE